MHSLDNPFYKKLQCLLESTVSDKHIIFNSNIPFLKLDIPPVPVDEIYNELNSIIDDFTVPTQKFDHSDLVRKDYPEVMSCGCDPLREANIYNLYTYDVNPSSESSKKTPFTTNFINTFLGKNIIFHRAQANLLGPGGWIAPHVDNAENEALKYKMGGKPGQLCTLNVAITHPEGSKVFVENCGHVPFNPGDAFLIDVTRWHGVYNPISFRFHLVIRFDWINSNLHDKELLRRSYFKMLGNLI